MPCPYLPVAHSVIACHPSHGKSHRALCSTLTLPYSNTSGCWLCSSSRFSVRLVLRLPPRVRSALSSPHARPSPVVSPILPLYLRIRLVLALCTRPSHPHCTYALDPVCPFLIVNKATLGSIIVISCLWHFVVSLLARWSCVRQSDLHCVIAAGCRSDSLVNFCSGRQWSTGLLL